jgi:hypothetical protein
VDGTDSVSEIDSVSQEKKPRQRQSLYDCFVNKRFQVCSHDQSFLLPPSLQDWLPENHLGDAGGIGAEVQQVKLPVLHGIRG